MDIPPKNGVFIDLGDANNPERIMCHRCRMIKPAADFKRRATRAQALAWGFSGQVRLEYESKSCKACYKPPKPLSKLTPLQIKQRLSTGNHDGSEGRAKAILETKLARSRAAVAQSVKNREKRHAEESWRQPLTALKLTSKRYTRQISDIKAKQAKQTKQTSPQSRSSLTLTEPNTTPLTERIAYTTLILATARAKIKQIKEHIANGQKKPDSITRWQDLITDKEKEKIHRHFDAIPPEQRAAMRQSAVLSYFKN
jgi:hypothetical protein